jgi:PAS domain S-box-containing protein
MSYLLTDPTAVLAVGGSNDAVERVRSALTDGTASAVLAVDSIEGSLVELDGRDDVGCVLVLGPTDDSVLDIVRAVDADHERVPVVVFASEADCDLAAVAAQRDCVYLPDSAEDDRLREAVADALETFAERRDRHAESSLFRTLLTDGELSIFAKDEQGRHVYKSDIEDDVDPESVIGRTDLEITPQEARDVAEETLADDLAVVETGEPIYEKVFEFQFSDHEHWSQATKVPWYDEDGEIQGLIGFSQDVTQRKIYERRIREQADRIDQFISYISHDLRTPLQIAYGSLEQARRGDEAALDKVEEAIERIEAIVDDLSTLSKKEGSADMASGTLQRLRADSITSDFVPLVEEVWSVIGPEEATLEIDHPPESEIGAEAETVRPAVENLLKNAVDHAGPDVTVRLGALDDGFFVADDGPGIPESDRDRVLESGYTTSEDGTGTGLGIVAETVEQNGWDLTIGESRSGGARFEITGVPLVTATVTDAEVADEVDLDANCDVGPVAIEGSASYDADTDRWTIVANGRNVWNDTHEFHLVYGRAERPVRVEGRITGLDGVDEYSKAGFTIRAGLDERDPFGYVGVTESHGSEVTWRHATDGFTDSDQFEELPGTFTWYRIEYVDGAVTCALSPDGEEWHYVDQRDLDLGDEVVVGLSVCSHSGNRTSEAVFADVRAYELDVE